MAAIHLVNALRVAPEGRTDVQLYRPATCSALTAEGGQAATGWPYLKLRKTRGFAGPGRSWGLHLCYVGTPKSTRQVSLPTRFTYVPTNTPSGSTRGSGLQHLASTGIVPKKLARSYVILSLYESKNHMVRSTPMLELRRGGDAPTPRPHRVLILLLG